MAEGVARGLASFAFTEALEGLATKPLELAALLAQEPATRAEPLVRATLERLSAKRSALTANQSAGPEVTGERVNALEEYATSLGQLLAEPDPNDAPDAAASPNTVTSGVTGAVLRSWTSKPTAAGKLRTGPEWNSPIGAEVSTFREVPNLTVEHAMALTVLGLLRRRQACEAFLKSGVSADVTTFLREARTRLDEAANVLDTVHASLPGDRCAEWVPACPRVMSVIVAAEAQSLVALKAEASAAATSTLPASLHRGAEELFERASGMLKAAQGEFNLLSPELRKYLAFGATLCAGRSFRAAANAAYDDGAGVGAALALVEAGRKALARGAHVVGARDVPFDGTPVTIQARALGEETALADQEFAKWTRENECVQFQKVPSEVPARPAARVVV